MSAAREDLALLVPPEIRPAPGLLRACGEGHGGVFDDYDTVAGTDAGRELVSRMDTKFSIARAHLAELAVRLRRDHALLLAGTVREARYLTVYFDTPDQRLLRDHQRDRRPRSKLRLRHYVDRGLAMLEIKTRLPSGRTVKQRTPVPYGSFELGSFERDWLATGSGVRATLVPVAWTACRRVTLLAANRAERLTFDLDVHVGTAHGARALTDKAIVELKQSQVDHASPAWRTLRECGAPRGGLSKFVAAMTLTRAPPRELPHDWRRHASERGGWRDCNAAWCAP